MDMPGQLFFKHLIMYSYSFLCFKSHFHPQHTMVGVKICIFGMFSTLQLLIHPHSIILGSFVDEFLKYIV